MEVTRTVCGSLTKRAAPLYTIAWEKVQCTLTEPDHFSLTAVHLISGIITVHLLVTLAGVGDAASVSALELIG